MFQTTPSTVLDVAAVANAAILKASEWAAAERGRLERIDTRPFQGDFNRRPFGFDVHKAEREYHDINGHITRIEKIANDAQRAVDWCAQYELPLLAVLPTNVWAELCKSRQLYTLYPDAEGKVMASMNQLKSALVPVRRVNQWKWWGKAKTHNELAFEAAHVRRKAILDFFHREAQSIVVDFFPNYTSLPENSYGDKIRIEFPEPDANFGLTLLKIMKLKAEVQVVVDASAIDVSSFARELLDEVDKDIERHQRAVELERHRRWQARRQAMVEFFEPEDPDPILVTKLGSVSILHAQYGTWPIEVQAVAEALEQDLRTPEQ